MGRGNALSCPPPPFASLPSPRRRALPITPNETTGTGTGMGNQRTERTTGRKDQWGTNCVVFICKRRKKRRWSSQPGCPAAHCPLLAGLLSLCRCCCVLLLMLVAIVSLARVPVPAPPPPRSRCGCYASPSSLLNSASADLRFVCRDSIYFASGVSAVWLALFLSDSG